MKKGRTELSKDVRPIHAIYWPVEDSTGYRVGDHGCTRIEAYDENGSEAAVPWIAVFHGDVIVARVPAGHVSVHYTDPRAASSEGE